MERHIPNLLTLGNLFCGFLGILFCMEGDSNLALGGMMVFAGAIFDVFDGMSARLLKVSSPIGGELDSLADVVTFGLLPSVIVYKLLVLSQVDWIYLLYADDVPVFALIAFLITACAALRLAKFNVDTTQYKTFKGMPSPANGMFFASLPLIMQNDSFLVDFDIYFLEQIVLNPYILIGFTLLMSWLMVSNLPLFSFKFSSKKWADNKFIYIFLILSAILFATLLWASIPVILFLYVILSYFNKPKTQHEI
ncbi:MAG: CDP-alcohol phosphatidyltransferase family protein [Bacteroidia bacterium]